VIENRRETLKIGIPKIGMLTKRLQNRKIGTREIEQRSGNSCSEQNFEERKEAFHKPVEIDVPGTTERQPAIYRFSIQYIESKSRFCGRPPGDWFWRRLGKLDMRRTFINKDSHRKTGFSTYILRSGSNQTSPPPTSSTLNLLHFHRQ
jgi:hypothetical protein